MSIEIHPPCRVSGCGMYMYLASVDSEYELFRCPACNREHHVAFVLECIQCDRHGPRTREQAIAEGWTDISFDDAPSWNWLGVCPDCKYGEEGRA